MWTRNKSKEKVDTIVNNIMMNTTINDGRNLMYTVEILDLNGLIDNELKPDNLEYIYIQERTRRGYTFLKVDDITRKGLNGREKVSTMGKVFL